MDPINIPKLPVRSTGSTPAATPPKAPKYIYNAALDTYATVDDDAAARAKVALRGFVAGLDAWLAPKG